MTDLCKDDFYCRDKLMSQLQTNRQKTTEIDLASKHRDNKSEPEESEPESSESILFPLISRPRE